MNKIVKQVEDIVGYLQPLQVSNEQQTQIIEHLEEKVSSHRIQTISPTTKALTGVAIATLASSPLINLLDSTGLGLSLGLGIAYGRKVGEKIASVLEDASIIQKQQKLALQNVACPVCLSFLSFSEEELQAIEERGYIVKTCGECSQPLRMTEQSIRLIPQKGIQFYISPKCICGYHVLSGVIREEVIQTIVTCSHCERKYYVSRDMELCSLYTDMQAMINERKRDS